MRARMSCGRGLVVGLIAVLLAWGCAAPARKGDPRLRVGPVHRAYVGAPEVRLRPVTVGGLSVARAPLGRAAGRIAAVRGGPVVVEDASAVTLGPGDVDLLARAMELAHAERALTPTTVLVVPVSGRGVTGYCAWRGEGEPGRGKAAVVVVLPESMRARSNWFVREDRLWEWTLTHELGHVLGVPADASHAWRVPNLGVHCTDSACVMYTGFDWRVLWTGIVKGWPMDFCGRCRGEVERARQESNGAAATHSMR
jgi:hypothetical protein